MSLTVQVSGTDVSVSQTGTTAVTVSSTGIVGATGAAGSQGAQGAAGNTGAQGAQGVAGNNGTNGTNGAQGAQGAPGTSGTSTFPYSGSAVITGSLEIFNTVSGYPITTTGDAGIKLIRSSSAFGYAGSTWGGYLSPLTATAIYNQAGGQLGGTKNPLSLYPLSTGQDVALATVNYGANLLISASNEIYLGYGSSNTAAKTFIRDTAIINGSLTVSGSARSTGGFTGSLVGTASFAITASYAISSSSAISASYAITTSNALLLNGTASSVFATTGSNQFNGNQTITGSLVHGLEGNIATGEKSHAEGDTTQAIGDFSHAEGLGTIAYGGRSHAEGQDTIASGSYSHAEGNQTIALADHQHVQGQYNIISSVPAAFIVGNGTDSENRSNLIHAAGNEVQITGSLNVNGSITGSLFGTASFAITASFVPGVALLNSANIFTQSTVLSGSIRGEVNALSISSNTASLDCSLDNFYTLQLVQATNTFINPSNIRPGQTINLRVNTTGSATVSFPTTVKQVSGSAYVPTTTTGVDVVTFISFDSSSLLLSNVKNLI